MAKDKTKELLYKIEGLKRMVKRKTKRGLQNRHRSLTKYKDSIYDKLNDDYWS